MPEVPVAKGFTHCRMQMELLTADTITWIPYSGEHLITGFEDGYPTGVEYLISTRRFPLFTDGGWELYLGAHYQEHHRGDPYTALASC